MPINAPCVITSIENLSKSAAKNKKKREAQKRSKQLGAGKDEPQGLGKSTSEEQGQALATAGYLLHGGTSKPVTEPRTW